MKSALSACLLIAAVSSINAQSLTRCELDAPGGVSSELVGSVEVRRGGGGIIVNCRARNIRLQADSGEMFGDDRVELYGKVHYDEPTRIDLRSDRLTYLMREEQVIVKGHVIARLPSGSTLVGPEATYLRAVPRVRSIEELSATQSPTVTIAGRRDNEKPVVVNARTVYMRGDSVIYASRNVIINRVDLLAHADSAFLDGRVGVETMRLMFNPSIEGLEGRKFKLEGEIIDAYSKDRKLDRVIARSKAHATSQDLDIVSDTIDLRMSNDAMERAIAWSRSGQAKATSPGQVIVADSIDVRMPKQKVRVVYAIRNARADADADTVRFRTQERDWLRGDTVIAWFDSTATTDTSKTPPLERVIAIHRADSAQALYHMAAADTSIHTPAIGYVRGREIRLDFDNRKISLLTVRDSVYGVYLEPKRQPKAGDAAAGTKTAPPPVRRPPSVDPTNRYLPEPTKPRGKEPTVLR